MRFVLEKTRSALHAAGLPPSMWSAVAPIVCFGDNVREPIEDDPTSSKYYKATGEAFKGKIIPAGARVDFIPTPGREENKMDPKMIPGLFLGYHTDAGGKFRGEY